MTKRWYLAGPMTGVEALNFPLFHAETARLRDLGFEVINPAEVNPDPGMSWVDAMHRDIPHLLTCDGVALLPGWFHSKGARLEWSIAHSLGKEIRMADEITEPACSN
jgi:hypothetical protein